MHSCVPLQEQWKSGFTTELNETIRTVVPYFWLKMGQPSFVIIVEFIHFSSSLFDMHRWMGASLLFPISKARQIKRHLHYACNVHSCLLHESHEKWLSGIDFILFSCLWKTWYPKFDLICFVCVFFFLSGAWHNEIWELQILSTHKFIWHVEVKGHTLVFFFQSMCWGQLFVKFLEFRNP